jgi:hypothetical protein
VRFFLLTMLTILLAWGAWTILRDPAETTSHLGPPPEDMAPEEDPDAIDGETRRARLTTGTLVVTVRTPDGSVPADARAGYRYGGEDRWRRVNRTGEARFTDAPLGLLEVQAQAPGYTSGSQQYTVMAGVRADVVLLLRRSE